MNSETENTKKNPVIGEDAVTFMETVMTPEEIAESNRILAEIEEKLSERP